MLSLFLTSAQMYSNEDLLVTYLISSAKAYAATTLVLSLGYTFPTVNFLILASLAIWTDCVLSNHQILVHLCLIISFSIFLIPL